MEVSRVPVSNPRPPDDVVIRMSEHEANMLRMIAYFNLTVADAINKRFDRSPDVRAYLSTLNDALYIAGIRTPYEVW